MGEKIAADICESREKAGEILTQASYAVNSPELDPAISQLKSLLSKFDDMEFSLRKANVDVDTVQSQVRSGKRAPFRKINPEKEVAELKETLKKLQTDIHNFNQEKHTFTQSTLLDDFKLK